MSFDPPHFLEDHRLHALGGALEDHLAAVAESMAVGGFASILDAQMRRILRDGFTRAHADEGTVWLADAEQEHLVPVYNTGPKAREFVGKFKQPLKLGLISMVFATERPFAESRVDQDAKHSKTLDARLKVRTSAMIAVPFYYLRACRGIVSCVQLTKPGSRKVPKGFGPEDVELIQHTGHVLGRLVEQRVVWNALGWSRA